MQSMINFEGNVNGHHIQSMVDFGVMSTGIIYNQ